MVKINVFGTANCAKCKTTKTKITHFLDKWQLDSKVEIIFHDMDTVDGRAEGMFHDVNDTPVTIVENDGRHLARWDAQIPNSDTVRLVLQEATANA